MSTAAATIARSDHKATATFQKDPGAGSRFRTPRYAVSLKGELIYMYLDTPTSTTSDPDVPEGSNYLVGFEAEGRNTMWWGSLGGAPTEEDAEALLETLADGRTGKAFIIPTPTV